MTRKEQHALSLCNEVLVVALLENVPDHISLCDWMFPMMPYTHLAEMEVILLLRERPVTPVSRFDDQPTYVNGHEYCPAIALEQSVAINAMIHLAILFRIVLLLVSVSKVD